MSSPYSPLGDDETAGSQGGRVGVQSILVSLPPGVSAGQTLQATSPDGITFAFEVPAGSKPGSVIRVQVPPQARKQTVVQVSLFARGKVAITLQQADVSAVAPSLL
jgi:hypothetical protein